MKRFILKDVKGNALDGTIAVNGSYSTAQSKIKPDIALDYARERSRCAENILCF
jgi:hypothetical protein